MAQYRVIKALRAAAVAKKEKSLMTLELLTEKAVGIGDHSGDDFFDDAQEALNSLIEAEEQLETLDRYFKDHKMLKD
jgi:hypothetical protein